MHDIVPVVGNYMSHDRGEIVAIKIAAVQDWPTQHRDNDVRALLGLASSIGTISPL